MLAWSDILDWKADDLLIIRDNILKHIYEEDAEK